jgi:hypothetical protein
VRRRKPESRESHFDAPVAKALRCVIRDLEVAPPDRVLEDINPSGDWPFSSAVGWFVVFHRGPLCSAKIGHQQQGPRRRRMGDAEILKSAEAR